MERTSYLRAADVEAWLNDNVDWLRDYLRRHRSILADQSRHTVPILSRGESTPSPWHSRTAVTSSTTCHQQHQQQRDDVTVTSRADGTAERASSQRHTDTLPTDTPTHLYPASLERHSVDSSKRHVRRQLFAKSRLCSDQFNNEQDKTCVSLDWSVSSRSYDLYHTLLQCQFATRRPLSNAAICPSVRLSVCLSHAPSLTSVYFMAVITTEH